MAEMRNKRIAKVLFEAAHGYGVSEREILVAINRIPYEMVPDFLYTLARVAEKSGADALYDAEFEARK